jgi:hypothetical protein
MACETWITPGQPVDSIRDAVFMLSCMQENSWQGLALEGLLQQGF